MSTTNHLRYYRIARNTLTAVAIPLLALRVAQAFHVIHLTGLANSATFVAAVLTLVGALALGWAVDARRLAERAMAAEWEAARLRRQEILLDGDEDRALWDSVPAAGSQEDTCDLSRVVMLAQRRLRGGYRQAG